MPAKRSVLVVDDDRAMGEMVSALLEDHGIEALCAENADEALGHAIGRDFDVVLSDIRMPGTDGFELLGRLREARPGTPVVLMTAFGSIDSAVDAMRAGAFHYVTKPFKRDEVLSVLQRAFEHRTLERENQALRRAVDRTSAFGELLGSSPAMRDIFALIRKVADSSSTVLITGESGTGKEVVSRTLHFCGARSEKAFVPINCTAIPEGLLESELFGHKKGSFTGAAANRKGLFERADGGTLFLDEIGDLPGGLQSKLLRVLQDGEVRPVGSNEAIRVDVRIVAATNKDLRAEIEAGHFRRDLFYRLNVIPIHVPPLRERSEDVGVLARAFVDKHSKGERTLSQAAIERLQRCPWEGNARELENVIERSLAISDSQELRLEDIRLSAEEGVESDFAGDAFLKDAVSRQLTLRELEERYTEEVLSACDGNKTRAAKILGINRRTLYRRGEANDEGES